MQALPLRIRQMNTVGKYAALAGQSIVMINIQIVFMFRPEAFNPRHFIEVFAQVGMQPGIGKLFPELLHRRQQLRR